MPSPIYVHLRELAVLPEDSDDAAALLKSVRDLYHLLKATEAAHITNGLRDGEFEFEAAQNELAEQRAEFAGLVRKLTRGWSYDGLERRNLRDMAYLVESAPMSTLEDLEAIRASRAARKRRLANAV